MMETIEKISEANLSEAESFLAKHEDTAVFLLGHLHAHGPYLGASPNSGNFKLIKRQGKVVCLCCLTKRGNLLVQAERPYEPLYDLLITCCQEEPLELRGVIGEWEFSKDFWDHLIKYKLINKETFSSKEINYTLSLAEHYKVGGEGARLLSPSDYMLWEPLRRDYLIEQGLPCNLSDKERREEFVERCNQSMIWGLFIGTELVSIANLNAKTQSIATVGGVYTIPSRRRQSLGKQLMQKLLFDCKNKLLLTKLIIFTGETENKPAQKLYEALGCQKAGHFALLFGEK